MHVTKKRALDIHFNLSNNLKFNNNKNKYAAGRNVKILQGIVDEIQEKVSDIKDKNASVDEKGFPFPSEDGNGFRNKMEDDLKIKAAIKEITSEQVDIEFYNFSDNEEIRGLHISYKLLFEGFIPEDKEPIEEDSIHVVMEKSVEFPVFIEENNTLI